MPSKSDSPYANFRPDEDSVIDAPEPPPAPIEEDRGEVTTKAPKRKSKGKVVLIIGVILFTVLVAAIFIYIFLSNVLGNKKTEEPVKENPALAEEKSGTPDLGRFQEQVAEQMRAEEARRREEAARKAVEDAQRQQPSTQSSNRGQQPDLGKYANQPQSGQGGGSNEPAPLTPAQEAAQRRLQDDLLFDGDNSAHAVASNARGGNANGLPISTKGTIGDSLATEVYPAGNAYIRPDRSLLLMHGTNIPCTLIPQIVTDYPGNTQCLINRDVYSADGSTVLINRGATAFGERKVSMNMGVAKVFVAWGDIENPDGVHININSLATGPLGAAGIDAWVDNHYLQRFGGAIFLSFLDDVFDAMKQSKSSKNVQYDNSTDNASDMASDALQNTINIPPTGYVNQGAQTNILVARDVDFRSIYRIERTGAR
jgi:type IV secretion system protein VirB10